jgi:DNA-binding NarL/FixJ family response regulator
MRITLCCKEPLLNEALASLLNHEGSFQVAAAEESPRAAVMASKEHRAQVIVVDTLGLESNELDFLMGARTFGDFGIVLIHDANDAQYGDYTVDGKVDRKHSSHALFRTVREVGASFGAIVKPGRVREGVRNYGNGNDLTRREFEVAQLVAKGFSNRRISVVTGLREQSVKNLVSVIMRKLHCENRVQVALRLAVPGAPNAADEKVE